MDKPRNIAEPFGSLDKRLHILTRRRIDVRNAYFVPCILQNLCCRICVIQAHIGQQDVLTNTDSPGNGLTNLTCSDDDNYIFRTFSFHLLLLS